MASNYTENYQLPIWAAGDAFLRTEFNDANQKVEGALTELDGRIGDNAAAVQGVVSAIPKMASGSYTGTGSSSHTVQVGFSPKLFLIARTDGYEHHLMMMGDFAESVDENGGSGRQVSGDMYQVHATAQGVSLSCTFSWDQSRLAASVCNVSGVKYAWFALG